MKKLINSKLYITVFATMIAFAITGCFPVPVLVSIEQIGGKTEAIKPESKTISRFESNDVVAKVDFAEFLYSSFLDETLSQIEFPDLLQGSLSKKDKITLVSIEKSNPKTIDANIFLERALIKNLLRKGYSVYNRNMNVMRQSVIENNSVPVVGIDSIRLLSLDYKLPQSDMLIGYRLLEIGCYKLSANSKDSVLRVGKALVEVSVINPKTQQIIYNDILSAYHESTISNQLESTIQNFHYQFKPYSLTVGTPPEGTISNYSLPIKKEVKEVVTRVEQKSIPSVANSQLLFILTNITSKMDFKIMEVESNTDVKYFSLDSKSEMSQLRYEWKLSSGDDEATPGDYVLLYRNKLSGWESLKRFKVRAY